MTSRILFAATAAVLSVSCAHTVDGTASYDTPDPGPAAIPAQGSTPSAGSDRAAPSRLLPVDAEARSWVDSTLASLDLRGQVGQLVVPWMSGRYVPIDSHEWAALRRWVDAGIGGIITSVGPPVELADKLNRLQRAAAVPLLISSDLEHGPGQRLAAGVLLPWGTDLGGGTTFPPVMALGAIGDPELAYALGRITAIEARAVGIHLNFAPVVDVNNNPANPIINTRSYGGDAASVGRLAAAQVRGLQDHGMLATAKHFPGHGDVSDDSHLVPLILRIDAARADSVELVPYRAVIDAGVAGVMSAHIGFPALTGDSITPATLSPRMLDSLLVGELGFQGLVVTDALNMGAIVSRYGAGDAAVRALAAGADILLQPQDPVEVMDAVVAAVEAGRLSAARVRRSARKVLESKTRVGLHRARTVDLTAVAEVVGADAHEAVAREVAERSITLVRDRDGRVPLDPARDGRILSIIYTDDVDPFAGRAFQTALASRVPDLERVLLGPNEPAAVLDSVARRAEGAGLVIFASDVRVRSSKGSLAVEEPVAARVREAAARGAVVAVSFGNPYVLTQFPAVGTYLVAWGREGTSQAAAARALLGEIPIRATLPIGIPPLHRRGDGLTRSVADGRAARLDRRVIPAIDSAILAAIDDRVTPGAALAVGRVGEPPVLRSYGAVDYVPGAATVTDSTLYDVASLTKVVGTTTAIMLLVDRGRIELDAPLSRYLPSWPAGGWRDSVTIRRLLRHRAGLPPFVRFWHPSAGALRGDDAVVAAIAALDAHYPPGQRTVYSDLGFILLGATVEAVSGQPLDAFLDREAWTPLGMAETGYLPRPERMAGVRAEAGLVAAGAALAPVDRIAPTEVDTVFRHEHVRGVVHDENAFAMGGVAGHAGLFSTARDLARFAQMLLGDGRLGDVRLLEPATVAAFTTRASGADRALGWDLAPGSGRIAAPLSNRAFGHTGFTGTSLWVDPTRGLYVVLLTNRVNPTRAGAGITALRRRVHELAARAIDASVETRDQDPG